MPFSNITSLTATKFGMPPTELILLAKARPRIGLIKYSDNETRDG